MDISTVPQRRRRQQGAEPALLFSQTFEWKYSIMNTTLTIGYAAMLEQFHPTEVIVAELARAGHLRA